MVDAREYHERTNQTPGGRSSGHQRQERNRPRPFKSYESLEVYPLPEIDPPEIPALEAIATSRAEPPHSSTGIDLTDIATICYLAGGITQETTYQGEQVRFRAASCTGNLHHIELYLVIGDVDGIDPGVYHFDPTKFSLGRLRADDHRGVLCEATDNGNEDAPVTVVLTSTWWCNAWKYGDRTYRHAFWDGGTVIANLLAAAHGSGHRTDVVSAFVDDRVAELIGIAPIEEAPIALVNLGDDDSIPDPIEIETIDPATAPISPNPKRHPLIVDAWRQSRIERPDEVAAFRSRCQQIGSIMATQSESEDRVELDPVDEATASKRPLLQTIERRGSKRQFDDQGPTRRQLGTILNRATRGVPADWCDGEADGFQFLTAHVLVTGVSGVPDGRYRYDTTSDTLERLGDTDSSIQERLALNQPWAGAAHVNVYLMADVDTIVSRFGNRGYRLAQLEAGIVLGRLYLATAAHRTLGGTGLTFFDEMVSNHLTPASNQWLPMTMFAFGRVGRRND